MPSEDDIRDIVTEFHVLQHVGAHNNIVALIGASDFKGTHTDNNVIIITQSLNTHEFLYVLTRL